VEYLEAWIAENNITSWQPTLPFCGMTPRLDYVRFRMKVIRPKVTSYPEKLSSTLNQPTAHT
jgi:hypothetical protein